MFTLKIACVLALAALTVAEPTAHVILIVGQSNSVGSNNEGFTEEDTTSPQILQTSCCDNGVAINDACQFIQGKDPLHHECGDWYVNGNSVAFGMNFARRLLETIPEDDIIVLVPAGIGGTGFYDNVWPAYNGTGFIQAVTRLRSTFRILALEYPLVRASFDGIIWHQGENDVGHYDGPTYLNDHFVPMIEAFRDTSLIPQSDARVPFVAGNLVPAWLATQGDNGAQISGAIQMLPQVLSYTATAPSRGLLSPDTNLIHFSAPAQREFGNRYFQAWRAAQTNSPVSA